MLVDLRLLAGPPLLDLPLVLLVLLAGSRDLGGVLLLGVGQFALGSLSGRTRCRVVGVGDRRLQLGAAAGLPAQDQHLLPENVGMVCRAGVLGRGTCVGRRRIGFVHAHP